MSKFLSALKYQFSKNHLRQVKISFENNLNSMRYDATKFRDKILNYPNKNLEIESTGDKKSRKIAFAVTEDGKKASAGDYFTALELGEGLKKFGWEIIFLSKKRSRYWYEVPRDVDVIVTMLDVYDPRRIRSSNSSLIKIAWPRNWFDRWASNPGFSDYDMVFAPSRIAIDFIEKQSNQKPYLLPLATNPSRFNDKIPPKKRYLCDYCFTGSYWNDPREIMEFLEPETIPYKFNLYGKNWDKISKFKKYYQGFINYSELPEVYASTKIVIDDANRATKKYGSVNSRVFDALACGTLVITNGIKGSKETFNGKLPVFSSKEELNNIIEHYLSNDDIRREKINELQKFVLKNHTYINRAENLNEILKQYNDKLNNPI
jgi:O-antigen biosynthesis protein